MNPLKKNYLEKVLPELKKELGLKNDLSVPQIKKISISVSDGDFRQDKDLLAKTIEWLSLISGQKPKVNKSKKAVAGFNIREQEIIGLSVTLHGNRMYGFFHKLTNIVLPQVKDFQGLPLNGFDHQGNYNFGLTEQIVFPEVDYDKISKVASLGINIKTSAKTDEVAKSLLAKLGLPFAKEDKQKNHG